MSHKRQNFSNVLYSKVLHCVKDNLVQLYLCAGHLDSAAIFFKTDLNASRSRENRHTASLYPIAIPITTKMPTYAYILLYCNDFFFYKVTYFVWSLRRRKKATMLTSKKPMNIQRIVPHLASGDIGSEQVLVGFKQSAAGLLFPLE